MTRISPFARANAIIFNKMGAPAEFKTASGDTTPINVIAGRGDRIIEGEHKTSVQSMNIFEIAKSEVAEPVEGDCIIFDSKTYLIISKPMIDDLHLKWEIQCRVSISD